MTLYVLDGIAPEIAEDTWIAPDANLIGRIVVESAASVWFCATLRGAHEVIALGEVSTIQDNGVFHNVVVYPLTIGKG